MYALEVDYPDEGKHTSIFTNKQTPTLKYDLSNTDMDRSQNETLLEV